MKQWFNLICVYIQQQQRVTFCNTACIQILHDKDAFGHFPCGIISLSDDIERRSNSPPKNKTCLIIHHGMYSLSTSMLPNCASTSQAAMVQSSQMTIEPITLTLTVMVPFFTTKVDSSPILQVCHNTGNTAVFLEIHIKNMLS